MQVGNIYVNTIEMSRKTLKTRTRDWRFQKMEEKMKQKKKKLPNVQIFP